MDKRIPIVVGFLLLFLVLWLQGTSYLPVRHVMSRFESIAYDMQLRARLIAHPKLLLNTQIVVVDVDEKSLSAEGRWPWPRARLADLVTTIKDQGAAVVAMDMLFSEKQDNAANSVLQALTQKKKIAPSLVSDIQSVMPDFDNDALLEKSLSQVDSVIAMTFLPTKTTTPFTVAPWFVLKSDEEQSLGFITAQGVTSPYPAIGEKAKAIGFINFFADIDGIVRRVPLLMRYQNGLYPSLALAAARLYMMNEVQLVTARYGDQLQLEGIQFGQTIIPTNERAEVLIPFRGPSFTFPYLSATDVLHHRMSPNALAGKIVFIGVTAAGLNDLKATPIESTFPGIEINATIADSLLKGNFLYHPPWALGVEISVVVALGALLALVCPFLSPRLLISALLLLPVILVVLNDFIWDETGFVFSILSSILIVFITPFFNMIYGYLFETRRREHLKEIFGQYVPEKHIEEMLKEKGSLALHGEDREMTVLFADIRHFTTLSEGMPADKVKELLNDFLSPMTEIIFKHKGTIDKYVGDMIMAFWGAPLKDEAHILNALSAAIEMQNKLMSLSAAFKEKKFPEVTIGIGLNTGMMSVGDMGSRFRRNYTVLGDSVNVASRAESLTRYYDVKTIVTQYTQHPNFTFRLLDRVRVKGRSNSMALYELVGYAADTTREMREEIQQSDAALAYYFNQEWVKARDIFTTLHQRYPAMLLYSIYLERIAAYMAKPPEQPWDGTYTHTEK